MKEETWYWAHLFLAVQIIKIEYAKTKQIKHKKLANKNQEISTSKADNRFACKFLWRLNINHKTERFHYSGSVCMALLNEIIKHILGIGDPIY